MQAKPVARSEGLLIEQVSEEIVVYDVHSKGAHCLSPLAAAVFACCDGKNSLDELADAASERLGERVNADRVLDALAQLQERQLLLSGGREGFSRRDLFQKGAMAGAATVAAAPLISSIMVPPPAAAATPTCGDILCCACFEGSSPQPPPFPQQGQQCCVHATADKCNCTAAETSSNIPGLKCKQCKPQGQAAVENLCRSRFGSPPFPSNAPCPCPREKIPDCTQVT